METMKRHIPLVILFLARAAAAQIAPFTLNFLPQGNTKAIVKHSYYTLEYSEKHEQARWVAYELCKTDVDCKQKRSNNFKADQAVPSGSAGLLDYRGSGYDRGHLVPAGDMKRSKLAMSESFLFSNISPQRAAFNRGPWKALEGTVRNWAKQHGHLYIVTGPILTDSLPKLKNSKVSVPNRFYKALLCSDTASGKPWKSIAIVMAQNAPTKPFPQQVISIDSLEVLTGIDFYKSIEDSFQNEFENTIDYTFWEIDRYEKGKSQKTSPSKNKPPRKSSVHKDAVLVE